MRSTVSNNNSFNNQKLLYNRKMELILFITVVAFLIFYLIRPSSKEELKRFKNKDNWSNMGF